MNYITLKIELLDTDISRTIVIPDDWSMEELNDAIQLVFGWQDYHLWQFTPDKNTLITLPEMWDDDDWAPFGFKFASAVDLKVRDCFPKVGAKLNYEYDLGDSWKHSIKRLADPKVGKLACVKVSGPMCFEDIGGTSALNEFIDNLREYAANPKMKAKGEFKETLDWLGCTSRQSRLELLDEPHPAFLTGILLIEMR